jgi:hypothetical protein
MGTDLILRRLACGWGGGGIEWSRLAQDRDQWRALVNTVMKLGVLPPRS